MVLFVLLVAAIFFYFSVLKRKNQKPIFGVYQQPGKWYPVKYFFFLCLLRLRRWRKSAQGGSGPDFSIDEMKKLGPHPKAIDATYMNSSSHDGYYLVVGTARRPHGAINGFLTVKIPGLGLLETPKVPDTLMFQEADDEPYFGAEGLSLTMIKPLQEWDLKYDGKMRKSCGSKTEMVSVQLNAKWCALKPRYFDFDTDLPATTIARSISREPWSRSYFQTLKDSHQTHIEQMGRIRGTIVVDGKSYDLDLDAFRDRSHGKFRDWKNIHRYAFQIYHLEDGSHIQAGTISHPITSSIIEAGFIMTPSGEIIPFEHIDFPIWQHGENGKLPKDYAFSCYAVDGKRYDVQIDVLDDENYESDLRFGWEWESRVVERYSRCTVNGINGWGITEWADRNFTGRPGQHSALDPPRFAAINKG